ncbi:flagellar hook-length control protein FliK [Falsigemmobacter faecalis]|uniref:Flagellar hook-length control protein FliK n=1 Tax=Falsigemmobacter faecalis TaxID=2488730 RepID=A0A3P3D0M8_9RHOB|nr:flagellar hook-length control protein FliK [Falsigemmobacter faecalis]RRH67611.1 flagellar hook-length control protein FliK [Falsigemmobacter faecalis]
MTILHHLHSAAVSLPAARSFPTAPGGAEFLNLFDSMPSLPTQDGSEEPTSQPNPDSPAQEDPSEQREKEQAASQEVSAPEYGSPVLNPSQPSPVPWLVTTATSIDGKSPERDFPSLVTRTGVVEITTDTAPGAAKPGSATLFPADDMPGEIPHSAIGSARISNAAGHPPKALNHAIAFDEYGPPGTGEKTGADNTALSGALNIPTHSSGNTLRTEGDFPTFRPISSGQPAIFAPSMVTAQPVQLLAMAHPMQSDPAALSLPEDMAADAQVTPETHGDQKAIPNPSAQGHKPPSSAFGEGSPGQRHLPDKAAEATTNTLSIRAVNTAIPQIAISSPQWQGAQPGDEAAQLLSGQSFTSYSSDPLEGRADAQPPPLKADLVTPPAGAGPQVAKPPPGLPDQVLTALRKLENDAIELQLDPPELGGVRIVIRTDGELAHVRLAADRPETMDLLRRSRSDLEEGLNGQGFSQVSFSFDRTGNGGNGPRLCGNSRV